MTILPRLCIIIGIFIANDARAKVVRIRSANDYADNEKETFKGLLNFTLHTERAVSQLVKPDENVVFAPINIVSALGILLLGSNGRSKDEILETLQVSKCNGSADNREQVLHKVLGNVLTSFLEENTQNPSINITLAKSIFAQNGIDVKEEFKNASSAIYGSQFQSVDFTNPNVTDILNQWVSKETEGHIEELIPSPISADLKMVLASVLYFNGEWDKPFYQNSTWANFHTGTETIQVKMMENKGPLRVLYDAKRKFQVFGIPYKGKNVVMYILYPDEGVELSNVTDNLTADDLHDIPKQSLEEREVIYYVPSMNLKSCVNLKATLQKLGLETIFDATKADLSKISDQLYVSEAIHKVNVEITEAGTLGAASTALDLDTRFPARVVIVNRPFLFYVYHKPSSAITFWGTIRKPEPFKPVEHATS